MNPGAGGTRGAKTRNKFDTKKNAITGRYVWKGGLHLYDLSRPRLGICNKSNPPETSVLINDSG